MMFESFESIMERVWPISDIESKKNIVRENIDFYIENNNILRKREH